MTMVPVNRIFSEGGGKNNIGSCGKNQGEPSEHGRKKIGKLIWNKEEEVAKREGEGLIAGQEGGFSDGSLKRKLAVDKQNGEYKGGGIALVDKEEHAKRRAQKKESISKLRAHEKKA